MTILSHYLSSAVTAFYRSPSSSLTVVFNSGLYLALMLVNEEM